jgi:signal transduction histidine kinase
MLDVSKIENQLLKLNKEKVDLNDILSNVVKDYMNQIIESKRRIKLLYDEYLPRVIVEADKDRITQVVSNLLSNAVKFTKDDGDILISVRTVESSNNLDTTYSESIKQKAVKTVIVSVKDTGGRYRSRAFSQFIQEIYIKIISGDRIRVVYLEEYY